MDILKHFLDEQDRLVSFPAKRKMKLYALYYLSTKFLQGEKYTEAKFNEILNQWHTFSDPTTLRRELFNSRFIDRMSNGSSYGLEPEQPDLLELDKAYIF